MAGEDIKLTKLAKCAGCGAKVGAGVLAKLLDGIKVHHDPNLLVGFDKSDDASVYKISDELAIVQTVDFFPPIADDPYLFGQIAATNALSDIYAMGGEPKLCLNIMAIPEKMPMDAVHALLKGGYDKVYEAGALITGGHSIHDDEPKYGLAVTGFVHPDKMLTNSDAKPGDVLLLTKPIGIGVLSTANKADMLSKAGQDLIYSLMTTLNKAARDAMVKYDVHACTDVTGFGLIGHTYEMASGSDTEITLNVNDIDLIPEALELARMGILPAGMYRNRTYAEHAVDAGDTELAKQDMLYDPQTAGGLLIAVAEKDADALIAVTGRDQDNLVACQLAKQLFHIQRTVARINNPKNAGVMSRLGVDITVSSIDYISRMLEREVDSAAIRHVISLDQGKSSISEVLLPQGCPFSGKPLSDVRLPEQSVIVTVERDGETIIPRGNTKIYAGDKLLIVAKNEALHAVKEKLRLTD